MVLSALHSTGTVRGDDANLLLRARRLARLRDAIVRDYVEWLTRYEVPGGEVTVQQAAQYFGFLAKVRAQEATDVAVDNIELTVPGRHGTTQRPAEALLRAIGRHATPVLARRLQKRDMSPTERTKILDILREIEGAKLNDLLKEIPEEETSSEANSLINQHSKIKLRFAQMTGLCRPGSQNTGTKTVLSFARNEVVNGPNLQTVQEKMRSGMDLTCALAELVSPIGDMGLLENALLIPSGQYAKLDGENIQCLGDHDLSKHVRRQGFRCLIRRQDVILIRTTKGKYCLVQWLGKYARKPLFCFAYQPDGTATFRFAPLSAPKPLDVDRPTAAPEDVGLTMFVYHRRAAFDQGFADLVRAVSAKDESSDYGAMTPEQRQEVRGILARLGRPGPA